MSNECPYSNDIPTWNLDSSITISLHPVLTLGIRLDHPGGEDVNMGTGIHHRQSAAYAHIPRLIQWEALYLL